MDLIIKTEVGIFVELIPSEKSAKPIRISEKIGQAKALTTKLTANMR